MVNIDRYKKDLDALTDKGGQLHYAMLHECSPQEFARVAKESLGIKQRSSSNQFRRSRMSTSPGTLRLRP